MVPNDAIVLTCCLTSNDVGAYHFASVRREQHVGHEADAHCRKQWQDRHEFDGLQQIAPAPGAHDMGKHQDHRGERKGDRVHRLQSGHQLDKINMIKNAQHKSHADNDP